MIESRYSIEYVNPDKKEGSKAKKRTIPFIFLGLTILATLFYVFLSMDKDTTAMRATKDLPRSPELVTITKDLSLPSESIGIAKKKITKAIAAENNTDTEIVIPSGATQREIQPKESIQEEINSLLLANEKQESKIKQQALNTRELEASIDRLTQQLILATKKNKELDEQLNTKNSENSKLSRKALSKASTADKNYLDALNSLEEEKTTTITNVIPNIKVLADTKAPLNLRSQNNNISVSTNSQVDAILAAMQASNNSPVIKSNIDKAQELQLVSVNQTEPTDLQHIQLQKEINQLLNKKSIPTKDAFKKNTDYKVALSRESTIRKNAIRSITIKKGETLWSIAQRAYGSGAEYTKIINANPQVDFDQLFIGQVIRVPK